MTVTEDAYQVDEVCWFTKSMRMVRVVHVHEDGYTVEILDSGKRLFALSSGLDKLSPTKGGQDDCG